MQIADKLHCLENRDKGVGSEGECGAYSVQTIFSTVFNLRLVKPTDAKSTATKDECISLHSAFTSASVGLQCSRQVLGRLGLSEMEILPLFYHCHRVCQHLA